MLKRKVVIKEEDLYAFRRQRPKGASFRKDRRDRTGRKKDRRRGRKERNKTGTKACEGK